MSLAALINTAWMWKCGPQWRAFRAAASDVRRTQADVLSEILRVNSESQFGRAHHFEWITSLASFQDRVPLSTYEDYREPITRIVAGESGVLTAEPVRLLQPTGGSTAGEKLIPYTALLREQFQRGVSAWMANLLRHRPAVRRGRAYWSISPALGPDRRTPGGLRIGFDDDAAYLGWMEQLALKQILVTPPQVAKIESLEAFRYVTLLFLLAARDLSLISIWNPTFLTAILGPLSGDWERLCRDIRHGRLSRQLEIGRDLRRQLQSLLRPDPGRADELSSALRGNGSLAERLQQVWPQLALISCWTDASAAGGLARLRELFPTIEVQPKGLLATEGFVSLPVVDAAAPVLAVRCHFFEFEEVGGDPGGLRLAQQLEQGGRYRVVLTTGGGLYRYRLHDEIEIVGNWHGCPTLRFLGKGDRTSDQVGEKLSEPHVRRVLDRLVQGYLDSPPQFSLLAPVLGDPVRYRLYVQPGPIPLPASLIHQLQQALEQGLSENPHYRYAVGIGQLAPAEVCLLQSGTDAPWRAFEQRALAAGRKLGDIKPAALDPWTGWPDVLDSLAVQCSEFEAHKPSARRPAPAASR